LKVLGYSATILTLENGNAAGSAEDTEASSGRKLYTTWATNAQEFDLRSKSVYMYTYLS